MGERREETGGGGFVVPDVGAVAEAAAEVIGGAFEGVELAIGGAEAGGGDESGEIGEGGVLDFAGEGGFAEGADEFLGALFERGQMRGTVFGGGPGVGKAGGVPVADDVVFVTFGRIPAATFRRAIGEVPGEDKAVFGFGLRIDLLFETDGADCAGLSGFGAERAVF